MSDSPHIDYDPAMFHDQLISTFLSVIVAFRVRICQQFLAKTNGEKMVVQSLMDTLMQSPVTLMIDDTNYQIFSSRSLIIPKALFEHALGANEQLCSIIHLSRSTTTTEVQTNYGGFICDAEMNRLFPRRLFVQTLLAVSGMDSMEIMIPRDPQISVCLNYCSQLFLALFAETPGENSSEVHLLIQRGFNIPLLRDLLRFYQVNGETMTSTLQILLNMPAPAVSPPINYFPEHAVACMYPDVFGYWDGSEILRRPACISTSPSSTQPAVRLHRVTYLHQRIFDLSEHFFNAICASTKLALPPLPLFASPALSLRPPLRHNKPHHGRWYYWIHTPLVLARDLIRIYDHLITSYPAVFKANDTVMLHLTPHPTNADTCYQNRSISFDSRRTVLLFLLVQAIFIDDREIRWSLFLNIMLEMLKKPIETSSSSSSHQQQPYHLGRDELKLVAYAVSILLCLSPRDDANILTCLHAQAPLSIEHLNVLAQTLPPAADPHQDLHARSLVRTLARLGEIQFVAKPVDLQFLFLYIHLPTSLCIFPQEH